ncbi:hypothetical protein DFQ14_10873 [Halopolyspora algeriensis]|uniref:Pyrroloquinoline-quinone binding quinoprotein n=1 Tax=Halopolyspora algeriensis TaxID=1500506 RepID=A0A368VQS8_9ACTN|nr:hypothetical protein [Halopolyspora algeriensis]RCW42817.1 hypothetical protein DFQ14_10873 [Halopolyspora algeriensis]TQM56713.1 hypothetical protein FHU43_1527 [Halopolyspora algeriensis]
MIRPERRTRADLATVGLITVAVLLVSAVIWWHSDVRATVSHPAAEPIAAVHPPDTVPTALQEAWRAPSPATPQPVVAGPAVVTAAEGEVLGRDPVTGEVHWRYARDLPLCTVGSEWQRAIAVYRTSHNCSEVTSLEGATGKRGPQRNSDVPFGTRLLSGGDYVTATGRGLFETWRSDLVRTQQYGVPHAPKNPDNNLERPECEYSSIAVGRERVGVIEECPRAPGDRITVLKAHPEDGAHPEEVLSTTLAGSNAGVVAVTETRVAVALYDRSELVVYDASGTVRGRFPLRATQPPPPQGGVRIESTTGDRVIYWHTGGNTVALDPATLKPMWTVSGTLGSGTVVASKLLIPVPGGIAVHDPADGTRERLISVDRRGYRGDLELGSAGGVLLEQRGNTLVALR